MKCKCCIFVSIISTQQFIIIIKQHVHGLEAMNRYINSATKCQARIKGHVSVQFVKKYIKMLVFVISIPNTSIKQSIYVRRTYEHSKLNAIEVFTGGNDIQLLTYVEVDMKCY